MLPLVRRRPLRPAAVRGRNFPTRAAFIDSQVSVYGCAKGPVCRCFPGAAIKTTVFIDSLVSVKAGYSTSSDSRRMMRVGWAVAWAGTPAPNGSYQMPHMPSCCGATTSHS